MRSKWKLVHVPKICFRKNFLNVFSKPTSTSNDRGGNLKLRLLDDKIIPLGSCKRIRLFKNMIGYSIQVWGGNKFHIVQITPNMCKMFVGSFVFTKRFTRDIHKKQIQSRHKKAFSKKK